MAVLNIYFEFIKSFTQFKMKIFNNQKNISIFIFKFVKNIRLKSDFFYKAFR